MQKKYLYLFFGFLSMHGLFLACFGVLSTTALLSNISTDQNALLAMKAHITSDPSQILSKNWSTSDEVCEWMGVSCGSLHRRVTSLDLSGMNLGGTIPPHLGNLSFLVSLNFSRNNFHGELPSDLAHLRRLRVVDLGTNRLGPELPSFFGSLQHLQLLNLQNNSFTGEIPSSIFNASKLERLSISFNSLRGNIPKEIEYLPNFKWLSLPMNQLSGDIPLEIFNMSSLEVVELTGNSLSGSLPNSMCHQLKKLQHFNVQRNALNGEIPSNFSGCSKVLQLLGLGYNNFSGLIPKEIADLRIIEYLHLGKNYLEGVIPKEIANSTTLTAVHLGGNNLRGEVPGELGRLVNLEFLSLSLNNLRGSIPIEIFNISTMTSFSVVFNNLQGSLPSNICHGLPSLEEIYLSSNNFHGVIPHSIANCSQLSILEFSKNKFTGVIPHSLGDIRLLQFLNLRGNNLTSDSSSSELGLITSLTNCKHLKIIQVGDNPLNGILPKSVGNLSTSVEKLQAYNCNLRGRIPDEIGNLTNLIGLYLQLNRFTGSLPTTIKSLQKLQELISYNSNLTEVMQDSLCSLQSLFVLSLKQNRISGSIPECLGNVTSLRYIILSSNMLSSSIPATLWNLEDLLYLDLSSNSLSGSLPLEFGNLHAAAEIDLSMNHFSGDLPTTISNLQSLNNLSLAYNILQGSIPNSIGQLLSLEWLDLSHNNFSDSIPISLERIQSLRFFNVSFNKLRGEIPSEGPFQNFTSESFIFNEALCGSPKFNVPPCPGIGSHRTKGKMMHWSMILLLGIGSVMGGLGMAFVCLRYLKDDKVSNEADQLALGVHERFSYYELLRSTDSYNESNLLGTGSLGSVYRGNFSDGRSLAIKVFNLQQGGDFKSFKTECEVLRNLRHRNLTKVISSCSNMDFQAMVLEYMPNGSLEKWLYSYNHFLDIMQRLNIMIDVASALQYLHSGNTTTIVHCDLKPSNVLLDEDMVAHISDFGIAKLLGGECSIRYTKTLATLGYIAPEYGLEGLVSIKCDVYSYGILLMEVFTRMKPCNEMFGENLSLKDWVNNSISVIAQVIDSNLLNIGQDYYTEKLECLSSIMEVALNCSRESPRERSNTGEVLAALNKIKLQLLEYCRVA